MRLLNCSFVFILFPILNPIPPPPPPLVLFAPRNPTFPLSGRGGRKEGRKEREEGRREIEIKIAGEIKKRDLRFSNAIRD